MKITNKHNIPDIIFNAARNDKYSKGKADFSVTELIDSPQIGALKRKHRNEIEMDVSESIWSLLGTAVHTLLEQAGGQYTATEERLFGKVLGATISGGIDVQEMGDGGQGVLATGVRGLPNDALGMRIQDYKVTSVWKLQNPGDSWEKQLNSYGWLVFHNKGIPAIKLEICAILRDWSRHDARKDRSYPQCPVQVVDIPVWSPEEQHRYLIERVALHKAAKAGKSVPCTAEERWETQGSWAAQKPGATRATRVFSLKEEAEAYALEKGLTTVERPGISKRCQSFCNVAKWCPQFQGELKEAA